MRKQRTACGILVIVLVGLLAGNMPRSRASAEWQEYPDEDRGFSVQYPSDWQVSRGNRHAPNLPGDVLTFNSSPGVFDITVVALENDLGLSMEEVAHRIFGGHFGPLDVISSEKREVNGLSAFRIVHSQPEIYGSVVRYISTFVHKDRAVYWLFTQFPTDPSSGRPVSSAHQARVQAYERVVESLRLLPAGPRLPLEHLSAVPVPPESPSTSVGGAGVMSTFLWPSTGYLGYLYGREGHLAIDVWTRTDGGGNDGSRGNPIYSVADGSVYTIFDDGDGVAMVVGIQHSGLGLWTWYWHMADEYNPVSFIDPSLYIGQPVTSSTYIGDQGNRRWQGLYDIIVHLHFGVSNVPYSQNQYGLDPSPYFNLALNWNDPNHLPWHYYIERPSGCHCCSKLGGSKTVTWDSFAQAAASPKPAAVVAPKPVAATPPELVPVIAFEPPPMPSEPVLDTPPAAPPAILEPPPAEEPAPVVAHEPVYPLRDPPGSANYLIPKAVFGSGGGPKSSTSFRLQGTSGQTTGVGYLTSTNFRLHSGYWGPLSTAEQPPVADFSGSPTEGPAPLTVTFTNLSSGEYDTCAWTFGDGGTSANCSNPSHTYQTVGLYTVALTVTGPGGSDTRTRQDYIDVYGAVHADFTGSPTSGIRPLTVAFTNASIGDFDTCAWTFGDGGTSSSCGNPSHTYNSAGTFTVSLTVSGPGGTDTKTRVDYISVYEPVDASFTGSPRTGIRPLTVAFTNGSTGDFDTCAWTFGDGGASNNCVNPTHTYNSAGTFTVSLTVSGPGGTDTMTRSNYITVYEPVLADFSGNPRSGPPPLDVAFTNLSGGDFSSSLWDFGDGATSTDTHPSHKYQEEGIYSVSLTVSGLGGTDTEQKASYIHVGSVTNLYLPLIVRDFGPTKRELRHRVPRGR